MKENFSTKFFGWVYGSSCKRRLKRRFSTAMPGNVKREYRKIISNAKDIGKSKMISSYCMGAYFIALNRTTGLTLEENYQLFQDGLSANRLFRMALGTADQYLDRKKLPSRYAWSIKSHERRYENDWVVDILDKTDEYELGYDYYECGICKLCRDEGCPDLARYLCQFDFVLADIMGMKLKRSMTLAQGHEKCDFRYSRL